MRDMMLESLTQPPRGESRSASAENVFGQRGGGGRSDWSPASPVPEDIAKIGQLPLQTEENHPSRELGVKYKVRPAIRLAPKVQTTLFQSDGPGVIRHIWLTCNVRHFREIVLRMYWDDEAEPSVEVPLGDFFCCAAGYYGEIQSALVCVNPAYALNCYFPMPFRKNARITVENLTDEIIPDCYYTVNYTLEDVAADATYLHASFRREHCLEYGKDMVIADGIRGCGTFVGCYLAWQQNNAGWWGEGEVKMFIDGDTEYPTICGTGTEDYVCGAWCFGDKLFSSPYSGYIAGGVSKVGTRHAMYRFHLPDPVWFHHDFKVTIQALGWRSENRFLPLRDDISATAWWYQNEPHSPLPVIGSKDDLETI